ncbi:hypothetical protein ABZ135_31385 [Streptomyces sp. NPDC006339]|uniref:hypothetical protein n=1 Tax=Streptomyces sp. NPDC006339 TaxID=3156755 RepID=UPI0033BB8D6A
MTARRRENAEPVTPDLHDQWAAARLDSSLEELADLIGAIFTVEDDAPRPDAPPAVNP